MLVYDGMTCSFRTVRLRNKDPHCAVCGVEPTVTHLIDYEPFCQSSVIDKVSNLYS
jgi:hypothetical protein